MNEDVEGSESRGIILKWAVLNSMLTVDLIPEGGSHGFVVRNTVNISGKLSTYFPIHKVIFSADGKRTSCRILSA